MESNEVSVRLLLEQQGECLIGKIGDYDIVTAISIKISLSDTHSSPGLAIGSVGEPVSQTFFMEHTVARPGLAARLTNPKMVGRSVVGNHETRKPVRTEISGQDAKPGPLFRVQAQFHRHVFKPSVSLVAKELRNRSREWGRSTIILGTLWRITGPGIKFHIVNYCQVK